MTKLWFLLVLTLGSLTGPPAQTDGNVLLRDDFATRAYRWSLSESAKLRVDYVDEKLYMMIESPGLAAWSVPDTSLDLSRYHMTVTGEIIEVTPVGTIGLVFNFQDDDNHYVFEVNHTGEYTLTLVEDGVKSLLAEGEIEASTTYDFDLAVWDNTFTIRVNDAEEPISTHDESIKSGIVGLYSRAGRGALHVAFDDFLLVDWVE